MSASEPEIKPPQPQSILESLTEAFNKLPTPFNFIGLITVVAFVFLYFTGILPENFLLVLAFLATAAFLIYAFIERRQNLQERMAEWQYQLQKQAQEQQHEREMADRERPEPPRLEKPETAVDREETTPPDELQRRYMAYLVQLCGYPPYTALIDIREAGIKVTKIALERIYTNLDVPAADHQERLSEKALVDPDSRELDRLGERQRQPVLEALSRAENRHLVILGAPGSGKSTLVSYLTLCLAGDHLRREDINQARLAEQGWGLSHLRLTPALVTLREYAAEGLSENQDIWTYITTVLARENMAGYGPHLKKQLEENGILLLDGLDEVDNAPQVRQALKGQIERFAREFSGTRIVVTSRPYAYGAGWELSRFGKTRLLDFSPEQIDTFIDQWYTVTGQEDRTLGPDKAKEYAESLKAQVNPRFQRTHNLRELARNPLLLTMMVYIHRGREGGNLPHRREELYRLCISLLLELWQRSKDDNLLDKLHISSEQLEKALQEVAFTVHKEQPTLDKTADIRGELLVGKLHKYRGQGADVNHKRLIEYVRDRAGLLLQHHTKSSEQDDDLYRFPHRTFQEYLAGLYLLRYDFPKELARLSRSDPNRWREALLLAAASQRHVPFSIWALIEKLCSEPPLPVEAVTVGAAWGAFLAGQVMVETELLNPETALDRDEERKKERVHQWQETIVTIGLLPPRERAGAGELLAKLGDGREGVGVVEKDGIFIPDIEWGEEVAVGTYEIGGDGKAFQSFEKQRVMIERPYRLAKYPITNHQFQSFIDAPDWDNAQWWQGIPEDERKISEPSFPFGNHPRESVSWYQAVAFCRWLNDKVGYPIDLPHEYEWEAAARYPDGRFYPWGNGFDAEKANMDESGIGQTTAVGMYLSGRNPDLDLYDLSGNVWEWCRNTYKQPDEDWSKLDNNPVDDRGDGRVVRGGSWFNPQFSVRAASRDGYTPANRIGNIGIRVVVRRPPSQDH